MQGSSVLLLAGTVALVAGLAGPSLAAEDPGGVAPTAEVSETGGTGAPAPAVPVEEAEGPAAPAAAESSGDRVEPGLETEEVEDSGPTGAGEKKRGSKRDDDGDEKQALKGFSVTIKDFEYHPDPIEVSPGDEITWTNKDTAQHTATAEGKGDFDTGLLEKGQKGTVPFDEEGTFAYICTVHPDMKGKVVVRSASGGSSGGDTSSDTGGTSSGSTFDSSSPSGTSSTDFGSPSSSSGGGSLPDTGQNELPLLLLGAALIVIGLLARAFREYWIWR